MEHLNDNEKRAFHINSLKRLSKLLDCGLSDAQLDICLALLERKLANPEALAQVVCELQENS